MSSFGKNLIATMAEAAAHAQGKGPAARVHTIEVPDVRAIREVLAPFATDDLSVRNKYITSAIIGSVISSEVMV